MSAFRKRFQGAVIFFRFLEFAGLHVALLAFSQGGAAGGEGKGARERLARRRVLPAR